MVLAVESFHRYRWGRGSGLFRGADSSAEELEGARRSVKPKLWEWSTAGEMTIACWSGGPTCTFSREFHATTALRHRRHLLNVGCHDQPCLTTTNNRASHNFEIGRTRQTNGNTERPNEELRATGDKVTA